MNRLKRISGGLLTIAAAALFLSSCKKDDSPSGTTYPRNVTIEYKLTSSSGLPKCDVTYENETGGETSLADVPLPFSKTVSRTVPRGEIVGLSILRQPGAVTLEIKVNGQTVKSQVSSGNTSAIDAIVYSFD